MSLLTRVVAAFEHFEPRIYPDPVGIPTVGFGHVIRPGEEIATPISLEAALLLLDKDLSFAQKAVDRLFRGVFLSDCEIQALTSFTFNVGEENVEKSTLRHRARVGDRVGAAHEFTRWIYATGGGGRKVKLPGLVRRRDVESCWWLGAHPDTVARLAGADPEAE